MYNENTGNTETHRAVDERIKDEDQNAYVEGFASASGVRSETAASGGRIRHPETKDAPAVREQVKNPAQDENAGLADS